MMKTESAEIVSYIPQQLYGCLEQLRDEQGLNSVSQAVNVVLSEYFGSSSCQTVTSKPLTQMMENLTGEVLDLKRQVSQLQQNSTSNTNSQGELINTKQLAERLGTEESAIEQQKTDGKEFVEWSRSKDPEQISWKYAGANLFERI